MRRVGLTRQFHLFSPTLLSFDEAEKTSRKADVLFLLGLRWAESLRFQCKVWLV